MTLSTHTHPHLTYTRVARPTTQHNTTHRWVGGETYSQDIRVSLCGEFRAVKVRKGSGRSVGVGCG